MIYHSLLFARINSRYHAFKAEVLKDIHCETAQFWARYMYLIQIVLTLTLQGNNFELHVSSCCMPCSQCSLHTITTTTHIMYLCNWLNLSDTHYRCKELLEQNGFSVSQSLVLCLRNAFDITIRQTINPALSQRMYYRLQHLELRFILQMEWCISHHIRAQYNKKILQCTEF